MTVYDDQIDCFHCGMLTSNRVRKCEACGKSQPIFKTTSQILTTLSVAVALLGVIISVYYAYYSANSRDILEMYQREVAEVRDENLELSEKLAALKNPVSGEIPGGKLFSVEQKVDQLQKRQGELSRICLLYTSPSPRDATLSRMPSSA